jgi:uncharacterized protein YkwD
MSQPGCRRSGSRRELHLDPEVAVPVRSLFSSFLLALILATAVTTASAEAKHKITHKAKAKKRKPVAKKKKPVVVAAPATPAVCPNTGLVPDAGNLELIRGAIACLHDQIRSQNGLGTLADNGALDTAAAGHTDDMLARGYFDHETPEGGTFDQRILAAGYAHPGDGWSLGENLIWASGDLATPAALMTSWMNSEGHRENILKAGYRELGLAVRLGTPTGETVGVTVSAEFGVRD